MSAPAGPAGFDVYSDAFVRDPGVAFAAARAQAPVFLYEPVNAWVLTRSEDVEAALPDFATLSQRTFRDAPVPEAFRHRVPEGFFRPSWIALDPPEHTEPRKIAQRGFRRPFIKSLEPGIEALAHELIDVFAADGSVELMERYCYTLTTRTLLTLFDLPLSEEPFLRQLASDHVKVFNAVLDPMDEPEQSRVWGRYADAWERLGEVVDARRAGAGEDVISVMAGARNGDGEPILARDRVILHVCELAFAGTDTTANLMGNAVVFLDAAPEQRDLVLTDPDLWPAVVEETLRRRPSVAAVPRIAERELTIAGTTIPEGARVWLALGAAGSDEERWERPLAFDITRPDAADHVAFGKGRHFCMGAPLARAQATIGLRVLHARLGALMVEPGHETAFGRVPGAPSRLELPVGWAV